jgi:hypothetical protein
VGGVTTSASFALTNTQPGLHPTTTKVVTSGSPSLIDQPVTFTATVESTYGSIPNGETVTFYVGGVAVGTGTTAGGSATFQTSSLTARTHTIKASYSGDATFKASSGTVTQVVNLYVSTIKVYTQPNPSTYGQVVGLIAVVTSSAPGGPTGTVTFKNGETVLGTSVLVPVAGSDPAKSVATFPTQAKELSAGTLTITATYKGDALSGKVSGTTTHTVNQAATITSVKSSVNPSTVGQTVKLTATVTSPTTIPTGTVTFMDGSTVLGTGTLSGGSAMHQTSTLTAGSHNITVVYGGTANIVESSSPILVQTVNNR